MTDSHTEANSRGRRAGGIILLAVVVIAILLFVLANLGIIAVGFFMLLLVKDPEVVPGTYELDDVASVNDTEDH